jgi:site-specific DNA-methyltransferase (adenine-specific)
MNSVTQRPYLDRVFLGDCLEIMPCLPDNSVDLVLCDLPYGTTRCKWDEIIPLEPLWKEYKRLLKSGGVVVLTASQPFTAKAVNSNIDNFKYSLVWDKVLPVGHLNAKIMPLRKHEDILIFGYGKTKYFPQEEQRENPKRVKQSKQEVSDGKGNFSYGKHIRTENTYITRQPTSILSFSNANQLVKSHPTQKPVALFEYLIKTYSNPGDVVLDNACGSGTTAIAALRTNRHFICIEKDPQYCDVALKRIIAELDARQAAELAGVN